MANDSMAWRAALALCMVAAAGAAQPVPGCDLTEFDGAALEGTLRARIGTLTPESPPLTCEWHIAPPNKELQYIEFNTTAQNFVGMDKLDLYTTPSTMSGGIIATFTGTAFPCHIATRLRAGLARNVG